MSWRKHNSSMITDEYLVKQSDLHQEDDFFKEVAELLTCSRFGCGRLLTREEGLYGSVCIGCQGRVKIDIMNVLKFK